MDLNIDISGVRSKPVLNLARTLDGRFRPGSSNDIKDAVVLACYLHALGKASASVSLLKSFLYFSYKDKPEPQRHLWVDNCEGILLLSYIQEQEGLEHLELSLDYIMGEDAAVNPIKFMKDQLQYALRSNADEISHALTETPKYQCQTYAQQVLYFVSLVVLWPYFARNGRVRIGIKFITLPAVREILESNSKLLRNALESAS